MKIAIVKYNAGNIRSVEYALQNLGVECEVTANHSEIARADKVIFPGVGEASTTMSYLKKSGLDRLLLELKQPVLGICLGLQLMCSYTEEGDTNCLGIFPEKVKKFIPKLGMESITKVPHVGWNSISKLKGRIFDGIPEESYMYFVHTYYATMGNDTVAVCDYIDPFSAALQRDNYYATQFHPEKSGVEGLNVLENFIKIDT